MDGVASTVASGGHSATAFGLSFIDAVSIFVVGGSPFCPVSRVPARVPQIPDRVNRRRKGGKKALQDMFAPLC